MQPRRNHWNNKGYIRRSSLSIRAVYFPFSIPSQPSYKNLFFYFAPSFYKFVFFFLFLWKRWGWNDKLGGSVECVCVCLVRVPVCFSFPFPSPKEPKGFTRVLMASLMVFPAVILSTATTRQSTSAMAGCLYQRLLVMLMLVTTTGTGGHDTGSSSVVRILAVFRSIRNGNDGTGHAQDPDCTQQRENGLDGQQWKWWWTMESFIKQRDRCHVLFSVVAQSDGQKSRPSHKLTHRPVAVLILMSADDRSVFRVPLAAAPFQLPVIGTRLPNEDSTIHLSGFVSFFFFLAHSTPPRAIYK